MAESSDLYISTITLPDGNTYKVKDIEARTSITFTTLDINTDDGNLYMIRPDPDYIEGISFIVNTINGNLEIVFSYEG